MNRFSKEKITGIAGTVLVHAIVVLLLYFLVLTPPADLPEKGVEVMMGVDLEDYATAQVNETPSVVPEAVPVQPTPSPSPESPMKIGRAHV